MSEHIFIILMQSKLAKAKTKVWCFCIFPHDFWHFTVILPSFNCSLNFFPSFAFRNVFLCGCAHLFLIKLPCSTFLCVVCACSSYPSLVPHSRKKATLITMQWIQFFIYPRIRIYRFIAFPLFPLFIIVYCNWRKSWHPPICWVRISIVYLTAGQQRDERRKENREHSLELLVTYICCALFPLFKWHRDVVPCSYQ